MSSSESEDEQQPKLEPDQDLEPEPQPQPKPAKRKRTLQERLAAGDFDDDEVEEVGKSRAKRRRREESEEEEDSDDQFVVNDADVEDDLEAEEGFEEHAAQVEASRSKRTNRPAGGFNVFSADFEEQERLDKEENERMAAELEDKYKGQSFGNDVNQMRSEESVMPDVKAPKLFMVPCIPGKEQLVVSKIMQNFIKYEHTPGKETKRLQIQSAIFTGNKGYIYVEAHREAHVKKALQNVRGHGVNMWKISLVPLDEMRQALQVQQKRIDVRKGQWVRSKRNPYKGDLAQVVKLVDQGSKVQVKIIPRLDLPLLTADVDRRKLMKKDKRGRPGPRLFNKREVEEMEETAGNVNIESTVQDNKSFYRFNNKLFRHGYLFLTMPATSLDLSASPTPDEIAKFNTKLSMNEEDNQHSDSDDSDDERANEPIVRSASSVVQFRQGDRVKVVSGDLASLEGEVLTVLGERQVRMMPDHEGLNEPLDFEPSELQKSFQIGVHVKVIGGVHKDETGLVLRVEERAGELIIFSDLSARQLRCKIADAIESTEVSTGRDSFNNFNLHDAVILDGQTAGIIIAIDVGGTFRVMTSDHGRIRSFKSGSLRKERREVTALDSKGNNLAKGDVVRIVSGANASTDRTGTVKFIFRGNLFLHNRIYEQNGGMFVSKSRFCVLSGAQRGRINPYSSGIRMGKDAVDGLRKTVGKPMSRRPGRGRRDPMEGITVRVRMGVWKGLYGIVKNVTEDKYRIELSTTLKVITVKKDKVVKVNADGTKFGENEPSSFDKRSKNIQSPFISTSTPAHGGGTDWTGGEGVGTATPRHPSSMTPGNATPGAGSHTPAWRPAGSATPSGHDGSRTPAWPGARTPGRDAWDPQARTPAHPGIGGMTPGSQTPGHDMAWNPSHTPGYPGSHTPNVDDDEEAAPMETAFAPMTPREVETPGAPMETAFARATPKHDRDDINAMFPDTHTDEPELATIAEEEATDGQEEAETAAAADLPPQTPMTPFQDNVFTPHEEPPTPFTPGVPDTPATPSDQLMPQEDNVAFGDGDYSDDVGSSEGESADGDQFEQTTDPFETAGVLFMFEGEEVKITGDRDGDEIEIDNSGMKSSVTRTDLQKADIEKLDHVLVTGGEHAGAIGELIGTDQEDGIVKIGSEIVFLELKNLFKVEKENTS